MRNTILLMCLLAYSAFTTAQDFKFAVISDLHINPSNPNAKEDLRTAIGAINKSPEIDFVLVLGNISDEGDKASLLEAKAELEKLTMKYYAVSGNHDTKWSASGATAFTQVFGSERFDFEHKDIRFLGFASGPIIRSMDGHVDEEDLFWINKELSKNSKPTIVATHYPLTAQDVDNWSEVTDILRQYNVKVILSGHYRRNTKTDYEGIPAFMNKSTIRDRYDGLTAYNIYTVADGKISVAEQKVDPHLLPIPWGEYSLITQYYPKVPKIVRRSGKSVNEEYPKTKTVWNRNVFQSVYSSPAINNKAIFFGDDNGTFYAFETKKDNEIWRYKTGGRIVGTAAANDKVVVFGSTDKTIYGLDVNNGNVKWQYATDEPVLGSATIEGNIVYIGASDGTFRALDVNTGVLKWQYTGIENYIECKPLIYKNKVVFGAWDGSMYCLDRWDGTFAWQWKNPNTAMQASPGAVWPVAANDKVFFTTPDKYITVLNVHSGETIWRSNETLVRESIGISEDGNRMYVKSLQDSVICYSTLANEPERLWATNVGYGFDNGSSMLVEKSGTLFGSTKNGIIFGIQAKTGLLLWKHKIANSFIGTVAPINGSRCAFVNSKGNAGILEGQKN